MQYPGPGTKINLLTLNSNVPYCKTDQDTCECHIYYTKTVPLSKICKKVYYISGIVMNYEIQP